MKYHWIEHKDRGDYTLMDENDEYIASIGLKQKPNVEFLNDTPGIEIVLLVAEKIKELGLDKK